MAMTSRMSNLWPLLCALWALLAGDGVATASTFSPVQLVAGQWVSCSLSDSVHILCYRGQKPHLLKMFQSAFVEIQGPNAAKWKVYVGSSADDVEKNIQAKQSVFSWLLTQPQGPKEVQLTPFNSSCLGVESGSSEGISARLTLLHISYYRLGACLAGLLLLFLAPRLARSKVCHYFTGVSFGVVATSLVVTFVLYKFIPKKGLAFSVVAGSWMVGVYLLGTIYENARQIITEYSNQLAAYCLITGLISFFAVHRFGPVTNPRTLDCIQWTLQVAGALFILLSSHFLEGSAGVLLLALGIYNFPSSWSSKINTFVRRRIFRPEQKFISMEEYEAEGAVETQKALQELRSFCSTPQSNPWKLQLSLKDPQRFAKFVQGESHLNNEEVLSYNTVEWDEENFTEDEDY